MSCKNVLFRCLTRLYVPHTDCYRVFKRLMERFFSHHFRCLDLSNEWKNDLIEWITVTKAQVHKLETSFVEQSWLKKHNITKNLHSVYLFPISMSTECRLPQTQYMGSRLSCKCAQLILYKMTFVHSISAVAFRYTSCMIWEEGKKTSTADRLTTGKFLGVVISLLTHFTKTCFLYKH